MDQRGELLKLAAARIIRQRGLDKEGSIAGIIGMVGLGVLGAKLFPEQWARIKQWISDVLSGRQTQSTGGVGVTPRVSQGFRSAFDEHGRPIPFRSTRWAGRGRFLNNGNTDNAYDSKLISRLVSPWGRRARSNKMYEVRPGDTLWNIAQNLYGSGADYNRILSANSGITDPNALTVGQNIRLPIPGRGRHA